jgi:UDP-sugar transporter A1/2/3
MPPTGGKRYLTSTAVFLNEVVKLAIALTMALYDVSKSAPPSLPATSLFFSLTSAVFSGDSWKLAIPASLGVLSNSLQYIALSNMRAATFQVTFQLQFFTTAIFGLIVLRRSIAPRKWGLLLLLLVGVALVQIPDANSEQMALQEGGSSLHFPRSLEEWKAVKRGSGNLHKRSATYEGIEDDIQTIDPRLNAVVGLLAILGATLASGFGGVYFEKVLKDSSSHTSLWVRNVQLAVYSVFPALFIGVVFRDGDNIANDGFFQGYNWAVWSAIVAQAIGGILSTFSISHAQRDAKSLATTASILTSIVGSFWLFDFELTASVCDPEILCPCEQVLTEQSQFFLGSAAVLVATHYYGNPSFSPTGKMPPPIRVDTYEKDGGDTESPVIPSSNDFSIKLPSSPSLSGGVSTSRPTSPISSHTRVSSSRDVSGSSYFEKK